MTDEQLEAMARRLGSAAAARLDVERAAAGVTRRLREPPAGVPWLRIAAAAVVLLGGGFALREMVRDRTPDVRTAQLIADDLGDLSTEQLRAVLAVVEDSLSLEADVPNGPGDLMELDAQQLRAVLNTLEG